MSVRGDIRVGIGGWVYAPWRNNFYPAGLVQRRELEFASRHVTAIEVNGTYYGAQKPATYAKWRDEAPPGFVFAARAPKRIMAARDVSKVGPQVDEFVGGIAELGDKLGPLLWRFEAGRAVAPDAFAAFLERLPRVAGGRPVRHVVDLREPSLARADALAAARARGVATVFTDSPDYPSFADLAADFVYARLMRSRPDAPGGYPDAELDAWAGRLRAWAAGGEPGDLPRLAPPSTGAARPRDAYVFFIGAAKERNPAAAMALLRRLELGPLQAFSG
jgi:uncharacterized protein YecE (DUF72 family)